MKKKIIFIVSLALILCASVFAQNSNITDNQEVEAAIIPDVVSLQNTIETYSVSGSYDQEVFSINGTWVVSIVNHGTRTISVNLDTSDGRYNNSYSVAPNATVTKTGSNSGTLRIECNGTRMNASVTVSH